MKAFLAYICFYAGLLLLALTLRAASSKSQGLAIVALVLGANIVLFWRLSKGKWL